MPTRPSWLPSALAAAGLAALLAFMWWLSEVFVPLGVGFVLAFVLAPAVDRLQRVLGSRARAASALLLGFLLSALVLVVASIPVLVNEARHWVVAVSGEGGPSVREQTKVLDYAAYADPDATAWLPATLAADARRQGAPAALVKALAAVSVPAVDGTLTLADALDDRDGDGRLDPGYLRRLRHLAADRRTWLGDTLHRLERAGVLREVERAVRRATSKEQLRKLFEGGQTLSVAGDFGRRVWESVTAALSSFFAVALGALLVPLYGFFFLVAMPRWREHLPAYLPRKHRDRWLRVAARIRDAIAAFVRGRLVVCAIVGLVTAIGWAVLGVRVGFLAGLAVGALTVIPLANVLALVPVLLMALLDIASGLHGWGWFAGVLGVYALGQVLESVLNPIVVGDAVQLDIVTIIVALLVGGTLAGFFGLLVAVPVAATAKILAEELLLPRWRAWADYTDAGHVAGDRDPPA